MSNGFYSVTKNYFRFDVCIYAVLTICSRPWFPLYLILPCLWRGVIALMERELQTKSAI